MSAPLVKLSAADGTTGQHELVCFLLLLQGEESFPPDLQVHLNYISMVHCMLVEHLGKIKKSYFGHFRFS
jgi:hypothetical protein